MENQRKTPLLFADVLNRKRMFGTTNFATETQVIVRLIENCRHKSSQIYDRSGKALCTSLIKIFSLPCFPKTEN